jgi:trehalose 6-phosphate phosphatase
MRSALFLDIDGTLLEFADRPEDVHVPRGVVELLSTLETRLDGALALISGRPAASIDRLFAPRRFALTGSHGGELRSSPGGELVSACPPTLPGPLVQAIEAICAGRSDVFIEVKPCGVAVHHAESAELHAHLARELGSIVAALAPSWTILAGRRVIEAKIGGVTKGTGIARLHAVPPFLGRVPICLGDDITDIDAFEYVRTVGGVTVAVGSRITEHAQFALSDPGKANAWLAALTAALESGEDAVRRHVLGTPAAD